MLLAGTPTGLGHSASGTLAQDTALTRALWGWRWGQAWAQLPRWLGHRGFPVLPMPHVLCPAAAASKLEVSMPAVVEVESGGTARIECNFYIPGNGSYTYINWFYVSAGLGEEQWAVGWGGS